VSFHFLEPCDGAKLTMANTSRWAVFSLAAALIAGCEVPETATGLRPEGPPMIQQVFMSELTDTGNGTFRRTDGVLATGWHPDVPNNRTELGEFSDLTHPVTTATAVGQKLRIVFDELLIGNYLEEIQCRARPDLGLTAPSWSRVPEGTTPADIANCAASEDLLPALCTGEHATCLMADGTPIGVQDDLNGVRDGASDDTRLICDDPDSALSTSICNGGTPVRLVCGATEVKLDYQATFWQPAGNQLTPARQLPRNSIGPAIILQPVGGLLPPSTTCRLEFRDNVTDKDYNRPCAPTGGVEDTDDIGDCVEGDMSAFSFGVENVRFDSSQPSNNSPMVSVALRSFFIDLTAPIDRTSLTPANVVVTEGGVPRTDFVVVVMVDAMTPANRVRLTLPVGAPPLLPSTVYTVTLTNLRDSFGGPLPGPFTLTFTTGA